MNPVLAVILLYWCHYINQGRQVDESLRTDLRLTYTNANSTLFSFPDNYSTETPIINRSALRFPKIYPLSYDDDSDGSSLETCGVQRRKRILCSASSHERSINMSSGPILETVSKHEGDISGEIVRDSCKSPTKIHADEGGTSSTSFSSDSKPEGIVASIEHAIWRCL